MKQVYLILAAMMLLCLAPMPYGYFMLVRFVAMVAFGVLAYQYYKNRKTVAACTFGVLALLFQPFYKIVLGRALWNIVDVVVAILLIALFFLEKRMEGKSRVFQSLPPDGHKELEDNTYEFQLNGRLAPKELVYVASEEDKELTDLFETNPEILEGWGKMIGFHIIYLPMLMERLKKKEVLQYRAPYLSEIELNNIRIGNDFLLQYLDNPGDKDKLRHGFIRTEDIHRGGDGKDKAVNRFYPLSSKSGEPLGDQLHRIGKQITLEKGKHDLYLEGPTGAPDDDTNILLEEVKERIEKLRQRGIAEYILEQLIHPDDRLSRLVVTTDYRIVLPDYNDMEIKMEPLAKAIYLLFLKHPEGILFKQLPSYRDELAEIYSHLRPVGLTDKAKQSVEDVTNPLLNSINEKCARIRGAFLTKFDDYMAQHYYIYGKRGEAKKIDLPRDLVVWE